MLVKTTKNLIARHIRNNIPSYVILILVFAAGVTAGVLTVNALSEVQSEELINYFQGFIQLLKTQNIENTVIFYQSLVNNLKIVLAIWFLGATVIGIPLIFLIIGIKGFILGFSIGFIINCTDAGGMLLSSVSILPREIFVLPCLFALAVSGINFSYLIIKSRSRKDHARYNLKTDFFAYNAMTLVLVIPVAAGVLAESYLSPLLIRSLTELLKI